MKNIEGLITVDLNLLANGKTQVNVLSNRPVQACQIMVGKTPEQVLTMLPLMFSVCGVAQARSALMAITQQLEMKLPHAAETGRDFLVIMETAREQLLRIFMDWPELFDLPHNNKLFPYISGLLNAVKPALFKDGRAFQLDSEFDPDFEQLDHLIFELERHLSEHVYHQPLNEWLSIHDMPGIEKWIQHSDSIAAQTVSIILSNNWENQGATKSDFLPELDKDELLIRFDSRQSREFIAQPDWQGLQYETTPLSRQHAHPMVDKLKLEFGNALITRWMARLVELARIPGQLRSLICEMKKTAKNSVNNTSNTGIAQVEAARGRLIHRVAVKNNKISQYQILAPTEWNFHPHGLIKSSLQNIQNTNPDQLKSVAGLLINAIDPCVGYELRVHA